jgi:uncharacterized cupin superfamily protein
MAGIGPKRGREADCTTPMRTIFLKRQSSSAIHRHAEQAAWFHVVSGEIVEERWTPDSEGGFVHEERRLRTGQSMAAPADTLHCITALEDAVFVNTCLCDCTRSPAAPTHEVDTVIMLSRSGVDRDWATLTALGEPAPGATR